MPATTPTPATSTASGHCVRQAALAQVVPDRRRTATFAWYNLVGYVATATGALVAGAADDEDAGPVDEDDAGAGGGASDDDSGGCAAFPGASSVPIAALGVASWMRRRRRGG